MKTHINSFLAALTHLAPCLKNTSLTKGSLKNQTLQTKKRLAKVLGLGIFLIFMPYLTQTSLAQTAVETAKTIIDTPVYAEPFIDAKNIAKVKRDTTVKITQRRLSWIRIKLANSTTEGWVKSTSLRIQNANVLPTSALASQNTGRNTQGNQVITTAVRGVHGAKSNRYIIMVSSEKAANSTSQADLATRSYLAQIWGANQVYHWDITSSSAEQTQQIQDLLAPAFKPKSDVVLWYFAAPIAQQTECSFDFKTQQNASSASNTLSSWMAQTAQISQKMAQTWLLIEPIQTRENCAVNLSSSAAITKALNIESFAQDTTNINWWVSSEIKPTPILSSTPIVQAKPKTKLSAVKLKKISAKNKKVLIAKNKTNANNTKTALISNSSAPLSQQTTTSKIWLSYLTNCQSATTDLNQSGLISQAELMSCLKQQPQQTNSSANATLTLEQAGKGAISPYQILGFSSAPIQIALVNKGTPQGRALVSELSTALKQANSSTTLFNGNQITKKLGVSELVYVWGVSQQNELVLLFPNTEDSANQLDANSDFEWTIPTDATIEAYPTVMVSWVKKPLDFNDLRTRVKGSYFIFDSTSEQWSTWLNLLLNNQNEFLQLR